MNEVSSFVLKKFRSVLIGKNNLFYLSKNQICFVVFKKKVVFGDKNSDLFCDDKKKMVFNDRKNQICFYMFKKKMKMIFFKKRVSLIVQIYAIMN